MIEDILSWLLDNLEKIFVGVFSVLVIGIVGIAIWYSRPISGMVNDKDFIPAHYEHYYTEQCTTVGNVRSCVQVPHTRYVRDNWTIKVCNEERCKWVSLAQIRWDDTQIGSYFSEEK